MNNSMMQLFQGDIELNKHDVLLYESWVQVILGELKQSFSSHYLLPTTSNTQGEISFPRFFDIKDSFFNQRTKENIFVGESKSIKKPTSKKVKICFSEFLLRFILGNEVGVSLNEGFSFNEYLPMTNTNILITSISTLSEVQPAIFKLIVGEINLPSGEPCLLLSFVIDYSNGKSFANLRYYTRKSHRATWKFLFSDDTSFMTEYEKMFRDTFIHKKYILESGKILINFLNAEGAVNHAKQLQERLLAHDDSKIKCEDELLALARISNNSSLKDPSQSLLQINQEALLLHWKNNSHHPEHFKTSYDMTKLDLMEMCCDWHARSVELGTNFLEFVQTRQNNRFHFPNIIFEEIMFYCKILDQGNKTNY
ncbi:MAG: DUF5662 family protein [Clostridia bacterium]|nr:DUF5662 family protein [Clostridia bacterium]